MITPSIPAFPSTLVSRHREIFPNLSRSLFFGRYTRPLADWKSLSSTENQNPSRRGQNAWPIRLRKCRAKHVSSPPFPLLSPRPQLCSSPLTSPANHGRFLLPFMFPRRVCICFSLVGDFFWAFHHFITAWTCG